MGYEQAKFSMSVDLDNDAFREDTSSELARILDHVSSALKDGRDSGRCADVNGNTVGEWSIR